jgi:hypothetical protein
MLPILYNTFWIGGSSIKHNKDYALKLIQDKQNGINIILILKLVY